MYYNVRCTKIHHILSDISKNLEAKMSARYSGTVMNIMHFHDFYFLEAMQAQIMIAKSAHPEYVFRHSVERLENDLQEAFEHLCNEMAQRIYVYLWASALGEARHANDFQLSIKELSSGSRHEAYSAALNHFPTPENVQL